MKKHTTTFQPLGTSGKIVAYRTIDVDGAIFNHHPHLADDLNWTNQTLDESGMMFMPQYVGRIYDYAVIK